MSAFFSRKKGQKERWYLF